MALTNRDRRGEPIGCEERDGLPVARAVLVSFNRDHVVSITVAL